MPKFKPINLSLLSPTPIINSNNFSGLPIVFDASSFAWLWGNGGVGDNTTYSRSYPVSVSNIRWRQLTVNINGSPWWNTVFLGLDTNSFAWSWGANYNTTCLGDGTTSRRSSPVSVIGNRQWLSVAISNSYQTMVGLDSNSYAWMWGYDGVASYNSSPISVAGNRQFSRLIGNTISGIIALDSNSYAWTWAATTGGVTNGLLQGILGNGTTTATSSPVSVVGNRQWKTIVSVTNMQNSQETAIGLDLNGYAWTWGSGYYGLGSGMTTPQDAGMSSPVSVLGGRQFIKMNSGYNGNAFALDSNSYAWVWSGQNISGEMGINSTGGIVSSPVSVLGGNQFLNVISNTSGERFGLTGSTLYAWGFNLYGEYGNGTVLNKSSPVSVMSGYNFANLTAIGFGTVLLPAQQSQLWSWGYTAGGTGGSVGDGTLGNRSIPVSINIFTFNRNLSSIYG